MLLKRHLGNKRHSQYIKVSNSFSTVPPIVNGSDWGYIVCGLETMIILVLLLISLTSHSISSRKVTQHPNLDMIMVQGLCYCNSSDWIISQQTTKWSHRHNPSVYSSECEKAQRCTGGTITGPKHCPAALLTQR